jgi:hypothetical protein
MFSYKNILVQTKYYVATWMHMWTWYLTLMPGLMLAITHFLSLLLWFEHDQIRDDFYFHFMILLEICHGNWAQIRARMGYLQICNENS